MGKEKCISDAVMCQVKAEMALDHVLDKVIKNPERLQNEPNLKEEISILIQNLELLRREVIFEKVNDQLVVMDQNEPCEVTIRLEWEIEKLIAKAKEIVSVPWKPNNKF